MLQVRGVPQVRGSLASGIITELTLKEDIAYLHPAIRDRNDNDAHLPSMSWYAISTPFERAEFTPSESL